MKPSKTGLLRLIAGLVLLILLVIGVRFFFGAGRQLEPAVNSVAANAPATESSGNEPEEIPEAVPEEDAPGTPTPGFTDPFESGLAPVWNVIYGHPLFQEGRLTSDIGVGLAAGDPSWENYQIEFDVDTSQLACGFTESSNAVGVRVKDFDDAYWFVFTGCESAWSAFAGGVKDGAPNQFPGTLTESSKGEKHITIKVDETKMSAYENGVLISSLTDPELRMGGIFVQVEAQTYYDNFQVILLP
jgi:hypothetical protein